LVVADTFRARHQSIKGTIMTDDHAASATVRYLTHLALTVGNRLRRVTKAAEAPGPGRWLRVTEEERAAEIERLQREAADRAKQPH
jgi:hypothetical protein